MHGRTVEEKWTRVTRIAKRAYADGIDIHACVAMLDRGNSPGVVEAIIQASADDAAMLVRNALFQRLHMTSMRAFDIVRPRDTHLAVAFNLLNEPGVLECGPRANRTHLLEALGAFPALTEDPRLEKLRHYRNKFSAHVSKPKRGVPMPVIREMVSFALNTAAVAESLSYGCGNVMIPLADQAESYKTSADIFWGRWGGPA